MTQCSINNYKLVKILKMKEKINKALASYIELFPSSKIFPILFWQLAAIHSNYLFVADWSKAGNSQVVIGLLTGIQEEH